MATTTIGVVRETTPGERRVALVPDVAARLRRAGMEVLIEAGAGARAKFPDGAYAAVGATVTTADEVYDRADVLVCVSPADDAALHSGQVLLGLLQPLARPDLIGDLARAGVTAISLDLLPRTLRRAQSMDALTSQANIAGYKAVLVAADAYGGYFPMLMTAAGTVQAGHRAGARRRRGRAAGDRHRPPARRDRHRRTTSARRPASEIASLGARFLDLAAAVDGGTARAATPAS